MELTVNRIVEAVYKSINPDGNKFLLFKVVIDHCKNTKEISKWDGWLKTKDSNPERTNPPQGMGAVSPIGIWHRVLDQAIIH